MRFCGDERGHPTWAAPKPQDIKVGQTWQNRWGGLTTRTVIEISMDLRRELHMRNRYERKWPGVKYTQSNLPGKELVDSVRMFAKWAADKTKPCIRPTKNRKKPKANVWKTQKDFVRDHPEVKHRKVDLSWIDQLPGF